MTAQDLILVAAMAGLAVLITLGDLALSFWQHSRRTAGPRKPFSGAGFSVLDDATAAARRESIRRRLAAIQSAHGDHADVPPGGRVRLT